MRGANVVRRRSGTNPGETGATGAVNGGQADGGGSGLLAGGAAAGDGLGMPAPAGQDADLRSNPSSPQWTSPGYPPAPGSKSPQARGANVVRKRSVTNPGDPAGAAGAVSGRPADGEGSVPLAGGSAGGDGLGCRRRTGRGGHGTAARHRPGRVRRPDARGRRPAPGGALARGQHGRDHGSASETARRGPVAVRPGELARPVAAGRLDRGAVADRGGARCADHQQGRQQLADDRPCSAPRPARQRGGHVHPGRGR